MPNLSAYERVKAVGEVGSASLRLIPVVFEIKILFGFPL